MDNGTLSTDLWREMSCHAWTFGDDATVLDDYALSSNNDDKILWRHIYEVMLME